MPQAPGAVVPDVERAGSNTPWSTGGQHLNTTTKELSPIVMTAALWGHLWKNKRIISTCDNSAVVAVLNAHLGHEKNLMHLLRYSTCTCFFFYEAYWQCKIQGKHIHHRHQTWSGRSGHCRTTFSAQLVIHLIPRAILLRK